MRVPTLKPDNNILGCWQAWVEDGKNKKQQRGRYIEVPQELKAQVNRHMKTVILVRDKIND